MNASVPLCRVCGTVLLLVLVAGCGTPEQRCISAAWADVRALESERAERARNLARGYALERDPLPGVTFGFGLCAARVDKDTHLCLGSLLDPSERLVPINPRLEARRIALLDQLIAEERARAAQAEAECHARFSG